MKKSDMVNQEIMELMEMPVFEEYTYWEHLKSRKIILNEEIMDNVVEKVMLQIYKFNDEDANIPVEERKPITIYLNTPGGDLYTGLVLCNVIQQSKTPIHIIALGWACSMGSLILMSGHKRMCYPYSNILVHDASMGIGGNIAKMKDVMRYNVFKMEQVKNYILKNTKITPEKYEEMYEREWWMGSSEALEMGIVDEIIGQ